MCSPRSGAPSTARKMRRPSSASAKSWGVPFMYKPTDKLRGKKSAANPKTDGAWPYGPLPKPGPTIPSPALPRPTLARRTEPCLDKPPVERPDQPPADRDSVDKDRAREPHPQAPPMLRLTADEVGTLADRLFSRGISTLTTYS